MQQDWEEEWQSLLRHRDRVLERARAIQAEITAVFRRKQSPTMELLRAADTAEGELAAVKARLKDFLHQLGSHS